jgi:hypothetical protein
MDSNHEMMVQHWMQEEAEAVTKRKKRLLLLVYLLRIQAKLQPLCIGGSFKGKSKNIGRHQMAKAVMLEDNYFKDDATHGPKTFRRRFRMNKETFRHIVQGAREYDAYFLCKKITPGNMVSLLNRSA